ncbi:ATP-dependent DNA helicase RecG [Acuticoccus sp. I52.16.1]|uniref:ATP-dependent DNA helicase RecG n=1 Tax=Acuticoccus sp. I52.16.1 TaxID=2928472 RepID=UPI001FD14BDA|nr:ATP-dependent DNA helicase RecG [Acuticoccus sp. I52.16.1]UOM35142.1 ATP-dependent DNA helicase RecG [Acuticoccus sp. I52.16.1]
MTGNVDIGRLIAPVNRLDGVGPGRADRLAHLLGRESAAETRIFDLLNHMPSGVADRRTITPVAEAPERGTATFTVKITRHESSRTPKGPVRAFGEDETGELAIVFFRGGIKWIVGTYPIGAWVRVSGETTWRDGRPQIVHPDASAVVEAPDAPAGPGFGLEPQYPMTQGLTPGVLAGVIGNALEKIGDVPEWLDPPLMARERWPAFAEAYTAVHRPAEVADILPASPARRRLAYDELLASQLALAIVRDRERTRRGRVRKWDPTAIDALEASLPFALTPSQRLAIAEVAGDLAAEHRMTRLVQGDVGSGKTVVAMVAAAMAAGDGGQTAIMAPTDLVARQHYETLARYLEPAGIAVRLLTGRVPESERSRAMAALASGEAKVAVGTHALFQGAVEFADLALVVVDEQHRFGVSQRMALTQKGPTSDLLVMTATPIPRTLVLASYGDMDVSRLTDKPAGRQPIETRVVADTRLGQIIDRLAAAVARGEKAYWVCPLVEEGEESELQSAIARHKVLAERLGPVVGLVHGRTPVAEREDIMSAFKDGDLSVLVATTVVEVGVDVPDATIMVIENAERFGLSQLHQLRGRVGRGSKPSTCLLLYRSPLGAIARQRLDTMRATNDGFRIAEDDLKLRGEGELLGTRQSGAPQLRVADLERDGDLLATATDDARMVVAMDRDLAGERGRALKLLLTLYERRRAIERLRSG